jgi:phosphomannomutase
LIVSRVGHSFMQQVMRDENALFGAEHSGHFYYRDNFFCDSALITAVMVLGIMSESGQKLSELVKPFRKYPATPEENVEVVNPGNLIEKLKAKYSDRIESEIDGINIRTADWHASVRPSNTEPYVRVNLEAKNKTSLKAAQAELITTIRELQTH